MHDPDINRHATMKNRFTNDGLLAYVTDIMLLRDTDFFVGTFTSNVSLIVVQILRDQLEGRGC